MIWILLGIALMSGGAGSSALTEQLGQVRKHASEVLKGTPQRDPALRQLKSMKQSGEEALKQSKKLVDAAVKAGRAHERPSSEIAPLLTPYLDRIAKADRDFLDQRDSLRATLSREQWDAVFQNATH